MDYRKQIIGTITQLRLSGVLDLFSDVNIETALVVNMLWEIQFILAGV